MKQEFLDPNLFGNEAGEDEDIERLNDYYLDKEINARFFFPSIKLQVVRARKGIGKSALLCYAANKIRNTYSNDIVINIKASDLIALYSCSPANALEYINCWQQRICSRINIELGKRIDFAISDDNMSLVESSELVNFKGKNIVSALLDRLTPKLDKFEINKKTKEINNQTEFLKRYSQGMTQNVWLFIDDIDATYIDTPENKLMVSSFFSACRELSNTVKGLNIRASVRTDVWTLICSDESMDKCEQYMLDLVWSTEDTGKILCKKVLTYYKETDSQGKYNIYTERDNFNEIFNLVFTEKFNWGKTYVVPYRPIHILSAGRPRWAAQLCKIAALDAYKKIQII